MPCGGSRRNVRAGGDVELADNNDIKDAGTLPAYRGIDIHPASAAATKV